MGCYNSILKDDDGSRASHSIDEEIKRWKREIKFVFSLSILTG